MEPTGKLLYRNKSSWAMELEPKLEGRIDTFEVIKTDKGPRKCMVVDTGAGLKQVWEASQLEDLFKVARPGHYVKLEYQGTKPISGNKKVHLFAVQLFAGQGVSDATESTPTRRRKR